MSSDRVEAILNQLLGLAPTLSRAVTMGSEPFSHAAMSAVVPSSCSSFTFAPLCSSSATAGPLPAPAPMASEVSPVFETAST